MADDSTVSSGSAPAINVQAHFVGVVVSVMAAVDQVAQAVNSAWQLHLDSSNLVEKAFTTLAGRMPAIDNWFKEQIGRDLRRIRVRMVHYAYAKTPQGSCWVVESAGTEFSGSRELVAYAESAVEYGECLRRLLPHIEHEIANRTGSKVAGG